MIILRVVLLPTTQCIVLLVTGTVKRLRRVSVDDGFIS